jgi:proton-dependent oligopeptide transporter, POT family
MTVNDATSLPRANGAGATAERFPPGIPYIIGNEGAERFSFYGMRQILYVYLTGLFLRFVAESSVAADVLADAKVHATQVTHMFMAGVYLFPLLGAIIADRLLGKYRVIFWVSLIYVAGHAVLALAGRAGGMGNFSLAESAMFAGLALVAVGSGGIKPCVSANVGDQFTKDNAHLVEKIFQIFYFMINFGSFFASILTPWLYKNVGPEVAFGVPGVLMAVAAFTFWLGRNRFVKVPPKPGGRLGLLDALTSVSLLQPLGLFVYPGPELAESVVASLMEGGSGGAGLGTAFGAHWGLFAGSAVVFVLGIVLFFVRQRIARDTGFLSLVHYTLTHRSERQAGEGFWGPAARKFGDEAAEGPPAVLRIMLVFSMVSVFWALFDQHSSTWVEQAKHMDLAFDAPLWFWGRFVFPATAVGALYGAVWLFSWVANSPLPRLANRAALGGLALWGVGAAIAQVAMGGTERVEMQAAQISAMNPLMVMAIIPFLNFAVYGPLERRGRPLRPLQRMTIGMFLTALAFVTAALLQARMESQPDSNVHVFWQVPQYLLITVAEVLVSVTGLEFAYTQAPRAMKSTIMGFWMLCVTMGNVLVAFLAPLQKLSLSSFFWTFSGIMAVAAVVFMTLAYFYKGKTYLQDA